MADDAAQGAAPAGAPGGAATEITARQLLLLVIPAIAVGVVSAVMLVGATRIAKILEDVIWTTIPDALGVSSSGPAWIFLVLTLAGLVIGLVVAVVPGHAGPDPATIELAAPPLPLGTLPGLAHRADPLARERRQPRARESDPGRQHRPRRGARPQVDPPHPCSRVERARLRGHHRRDVRDTGGCGAHPQRAPRQPPHPLWDRLFAPLVAAATGTITVDLLRRRVIRPRRRAIPRAAARRHLHGVDHRGRRRAHRDGRRPRLSKRHTGRSSAWAIRWSRSSSVARCSASLAPSADRSRCSRACRRCRSCPRPSPNYTAGGLAAMASDEADRRRHRQHGGLPRRADLPVRLRCGRVGPRHLYVLPAGPGGRRRLCQPDRRPGCRHAQRLDRPVPGSAAGR